MPLPAIFFFSWLRSRAYSFTEIATLVVTFTAVGSDDDDDPVPDTPFTFNV